MQNTEIKLAHTDVGIRHCYPVIAQLRPQFDDIDKFVEQINRQMRQGYQLVYLGDNKEARAVAGFRIQEMLYNGKHLFVDDLVTEKKHRSFGYGGILFEWLFGHAQMNECKQIVLDSNVTRHGAHRFYLSQRMKIEAYHFTMDISV